MTRLVGLMWRVQKRLSMHGGLFSILVFLSLFFLHFVAAPPHGVWCLAGLAGYVVGLFRFGVFRACVSSLLCCDISSV